MSGTGAAEALNLVRGDVLALTGGGGKTSLLMQLAEENPFGGVLCGCTAKMFNPRKRTHPFDSIHIPWNGDNMPSPSAEVQRCFISGPPLEDGSGKVRGLSVAPDAPIHTAGSWGLTVFEADGSAGRPLKIPGDHENLIPSATTKLIVLVGLDALGTPVNGQSVHRPEVFSRTLKLDRDRIIDADMLCEAALHPRGLFRYADAGMEKILLLNKADLFAERMDELERLMEIIKKNCADIRLLAGCLKPELRYIL